MKANSRGFTLIELVVVITILGILAAFAIPRFAGLEQNARFAAANGMAGSMKAAAALAHSIALVNGNAAADPVTMEGQAVTMTEFYPTADDAGIVAALQDTTNFTSDGAGTLTLNGAPATCKVTYTAAGVGGSPSVTSPTAVTDC